MLLIFCLSNGIFFFQIQTLKSTSTQHARCTPDTRLTVHTTRYTLIRYVEVIFMCFNYHNQRYFLFPNDTMGISEVKYTCGFNCTIFKKNNIKSRSRFPTVIVCARTWQAHHCIKTLFCYLLSLVHVQVFCQS